MKRRERRAPLAARPLPVAVLRFPRSARFACVGIAMFLAHFSLPNLHAQNSPAVSTNSASQDSSGIIELLDGSLLHGRLRSIDSGDGLKWDHPDAKNPINFKPDNIALIRFPDARNTAYNSETTCQFRFTNGDEFLGNLISFDENEVELRTWFGGTFSTPRAALRSVRFFPKGSLIVYEGPTGLAGWETGKNQSPQAWQYSDGALIANSVGTLGRDVKLPSASRLEFDLAWNTPFNLLFSYYTPVVDGFNYTSSSYMFYINRGSVSLQRINAGVGSTSLGRTETISAMMTKKKVHLEFRANQSENILELLVDGESVGQWKDSAGWVAKGSGILFYAQTDNSGVKISNIKVSEWDGRPGGEIASNAALVEDEIHLANRDKVSGKVASLRDGKLKLTSTTTALEIPIERVTQIFFSRFATNETVRGPWEVQASVAGGGRISFALDKWNDDKVFGRNKNFGDISLESKSIRQMQFNLGKPKSDLMDLAAPDENWEVNEP